MYLTIYFGNYNVNPVLFVNGKLFLFFGFLNLQMIFLKKDTYMFFLCRLLSTVKVGEKVEGSRQEMRHQVEAIPGKLSSQTKNE